MGKILHECGSTFCHKKIPMDKQFCPEHAKQRWQNYKAKYGNTAQYNKRYDQTKRSKSRNALYQSKAWRKVRANVVSRQNNTCFVCGNVWQDRKVVDHMCPLKADSSRINALGSQNLNVMCYKCHTIKSKLEDIILSKPDGTSKIKSMKKDDWIKLIEKHRNNY